VSDGLRKALDAHPQIQVVDSEEAAAALDQAEAAVLAQKEDAARALGEKLGVDAVVYGRIVRDVNGLLDAPAPMPQALAQLLVAETLTLEGQLYPSVAMPVAEGVDPVPALTATAVALLPACGRVLAVIDSPEGIAIQLFPVGGRVLAPGVEYAIYSPLRFVPAEEPEGTSVLLARQDLRPGALTGRVRTAAEPDGHVLGAQAADPGSRIAAGQLVGLSPVQGAEPPAAAQPGLILSAEPANCVVSLNGRIVGVTPVGVMAPAGEKAAVSIARRDHRTVTRDVTVGRNEGLAMSVVLTEIPPFGDVRVVSTPPGATVLIDGKQAGKTPYTAKSVAAGDHEVALRLDGYKPVARSISVRRQQPTELRVDLEEDFRDIAVKSVPAGARVSLDGKQVGNTPVDVRGLRTGSHELRLSLAGHAVVNEAIKVTPRDEENVFSFRLRRLAGNLRIETTPPGAPVLVDGEAKGTTPLALTAIGIGQHKISIGADGYLPVAKTVAVQDQQTTVVREILTRAVGQILCVSVPKGAKILLDGEPLGVAPTTLTDVPVGRRTLTLTLDGYQPWTARVPVAHGETTKVEVGLIRVTPRLRRQP